MASLLQNSENRRADLRLPSGGGVVDRKKPMIEPEIPRFWNTKKDSHTLFWIMVDLGLPISIQKDRFGVSNSCWAQAILWRNAITKCQRCIIWYKQSPPNKNLFWMLRFCTRIADSSEQRMNSSTRPAWALPPPPTHTLTHTCTHAHWYWAWFYFSTRQAFLPVARTHFCHNSFLARDRNRSICTHNWE